MNPKKIWESKTLIFNALTIISVSLAAVVTQDILSPQALKWVIVGQAVINSVLRLFTKEPIAIK